MTSKQSTQNTKPNNPKIKINSNPINQILKNKTKNQKNQNQEKKPKIKQKKQIKKPKTNQPNQTKPNQKKNKKRGVVVVMTKNENFSLNEVLGDVTSCQIETPNCMRFCVS